MGEPTYTCAVWYLNDHGQIDYDVFSDEASAANCAVGYDGDGTVLGIQWADGTSQRRGQWQAFQDAKQRERERWEQERNDPRPEPETRRTYDPFKGNAIDIETSEPEWLGDRRG
jgi:hypothetical protein